MPFAEAIAGCVSKVVGFREQFRHKGHVRFRPKKT